MEALDVLANNIANTSVAGFKIDRELYNVYQSPEALEDIDQPEMQKNWTDFAQGILAATGSPLDLALEGAGFFVADSPSGPLYTRTGTLKISKEGELVTREGYPIQGQDGKPIKLDPLQPVEISAQGVVRQGGTDLGQVAVVSFKQPGILSKRGSTYFSSQANVMPESSDAVVRQGQLEGANGEPAKVRSAWSVSCGNLNR